MLPVLFGIPLFCLLFLTIQQTSSLECGLVNLKSAPWSNQTASKPLQKHNLIIGDEEPQKNEMPWVVVYIGYGSVKKKHMQKIKVVKTFNHKCADASVLQLQNEVHKTPAYLSKNYNSECQLDKHLVIAGLGRHLDADYDPGVPNGTFLYPLPAPASLPDSVLWTNMEKIEKSKCRNWYWSMAEFCAGGLGSGVLSGDSGGPVVKVKGRRVVQIGITVTIVNIAVNHRIFQSAVVVNAGYHAS